MSPHYERARTLYALWRLLMTHESGVAVVDTMMVYMGPTKVATEDVVLLAARRELRMFKNDMLRWHPHYHDHDLAVQVMGPEAGPFGLTDPPLTMWTIATLRVGHEFPRLEREFLELCVDPAFPHLRERLDVPVPG